MENFKARASVGSVPEHDLVLVRKSHYRRLLRRLEDLEDALALDRAESSSKSVLDYSKVRRHLKQAGKL